MSSVMPTGFRNSTMILVALVFLFGVLSANVWIIVASIGLWVLFAPKEAVGKPVH